MLRKPLSSLDHWVAYLRRSEIPVLQETSTRYSALRDNEDEVTVRDLATVALHDPLMALKLLLVLQRHRRPTQTTDITTIERSMIMLGIGPFFRHFEDLTVVEEALAGQDEALAGLQRVLSRARLAAAYARDWAIVRHDIDADEITLAALLHDMAEMLLWCFACPLMLEVRRMQEADPRLRSAVAQQQVLGVRLHDLQLALAREWRLPALLQALMNDSQADHPRVRNVVLATSLARHSQNGWDDPALPDDYEAVGKLLGISREALMERIIRVAQSSAPPPAEAAADA